ncbi:MAG: tandem-95 repeat protein, partial [DPANN group archaeon]|nr:tandem-95 repeat protein [DPANN group archaeon]
MENIKRTSIIMFILLVLMPVVSAQLPPSEYWGTVNNGTVSDGLEVLAWIDLNNNSLLDMTGVNTTDGDEIFDNSTTIGGFYNIVVPADDPATTNITEGGSAGDLIIVRVTGVDATPVLNWVSGSSDRVNIYVNLNPPVINTFFPVSDPIINETDSQFFRVNVSDPDGDNVSYFWYLDGSLASSVESYTYLSDYDSAGNYNVTVVVSDETYQVNHYWNLTVLDIDRPPVIDSVPVVSAVEDLLYVYDVNASDPDGDELSFNLLVSPVGMVVNVSSGLITWLPGNGDVGDHDITVMVSDGLLNDTQSFILTVSNVNDPPILNPIGDKSVYENETLEFFVNASDPDGDNLTFYANNLPSGATFLNQIFSWIPGFNQSGAYSVEFVVNDSEFTDSETVNITVYEFNRAPVIQDYYPALVVSFYENSTAYFNVTASDPDGDSLSYIWYLDEEILLNQSQSFIYWYWNFSDAGEHNISVTISDDGGRSASVSWDVTVLSVNMPPVIDSVPVVSAVEDLLYVYDVNASDPDGDELSFNLLVSPVGMVVNVSSGLITWLPGNGDVGDHDITVMVSDGLLNDTQSFILTVSNVNDVPEIVSFYPLDFNVSLLVNDSQYFNVSAVDVDGDDLSYYWFLDDSLVSSSQEYTFYASNGGAFDLVVVVSDSVLNVSHSWLIDVVGIVEFGNFSGSTTDFDNLSDPEHVYNVTFENDFGGIYFGEQELNLSRLAQDLSVISQAVIVSYNFVGVDTAVIPDLAGYSASLTMSGVPENFIIYYSDVFSRDPNSVSRPCPSDRCFGVNYNAQ